MVDTRRLWKYNKHRTLRSGREIGRNTKEGRNLRTKVGTGVNPKTTSSVILVLSTTRQVTRLKGHQRVYCELVQSGTVPTKGFRFSPCKDLGVLYPSGG